MGGGERNTIRVLETYRTGYYQTVDRKQNHTVVVDVPRGGGEEYHTGVGKILYGIAQTVVRKQNRMVVVDVPRGGGIPYGC